MAITKYLSIITLSEKGLNVPIKRQVGWMDKKTRPFHMLSINSLQIKRNTKTKIKEWKEMFYENGNKLTNKKSWSSNTCIKQNKL